jgi:NADPH-dependent glutamate synthase beta subunit-like oxidoreductase
VEIIRMELSQADESGRRRPVPIESSRYTTAYDTLIKSVGQTTDIPEGFTLATDKGRRVLADPDTMATSRPGVYAGGDAVSGPASVIEAIADGRKAAVSIDKYLGGKGDISEVLAPPEEVVPAGESREIEGTQFRPPGSMLPLEARINSFAQVELGFNKEQVIREAKRCLWCDLEEH